MIGSAIIKRIGFYLFLIYSFLPSQALAQTLPPQAIRYLAGKETDDLEKANMKFIRGARREEVDTIGKGRVNFF